MRIGPYELLGKLGEGGMGVVYRARHTDLDRQVALKVIGGGAGSTAAAAETVATPGGGDGAVPSTREQMLLARFRREAQAAGRLAGHPGIVGVHDVGLHPEHNTLYLAMELVEGRSLDDVIQEGDLTVAQAVAWFIGIADAVHYAHTQGVLHRDLKPGNVLVTEAGEPKVTDFGLAKSTEATPDVTRLTQAGELVGTPAYMAPEQVRGLGVDARTDVYALGVTLFETLAGRTPFEGDSIYTVVAKVVRDDPPPLRSVAPHVPAALEAVVDRCLQKSPDRRYASAAELAEDLRRFERGEPVAARVRSPLRRWWVRRGRWTVAAVALAAGAAAGTWWLAGRHRSVEDDGRRAIDDTKQQRTHAERAATLSSSWLAMSGRGVPLIRSLQDHYYGGAGDAASLSRQLESLRQVAAAAAAADPVTPQGWLALAGVYRRADGAWDRLAGLGDAHPDNPLLQVLVAHGALAHFADALEMPSTEFTAGASAMAGYAETPAMITWRRRAAAALDRAAASPAWPLLSQAEAVTAYAAAARAMAGEQYAAAADALAPLADDPLFGDEATALAAFASLFAGRPEAAARAWEQVGRRGWTDALYRASITRIILATRAAAQGADPAPHYDAALRAAQAGETARPGHSKTCAAVGAAHWARALFLVEAGRDPVADLEAALAAFGRAAAAGPLGLNGFLNMAGARQTLAKERAKRGVDPRPELKAALAELTQGLASDPEWGSARRALGDIWVALARYEAAYGGNPAPAFEQARAAMQAVLDQRPDDFGALVGLSNVWRVQADVEAMHGPPRRATIERGLPPIQRALKLRPDHVATLSNAGILWRMLGESRLAAGEDPTGDWNRAVELFERGLKQQPGHIGLLNNRALMHRSIGERKQADGSGDPIPHYRAAIADLTTAVEAQPEGIVPRYNRGVNYDLLAMVLESRGADAGPDRARALADFDAVLERNPNMWQALMVRGHLNRRMGLLAEALEDYRAVLRINDKIQDARDWIRRIEAERR
ncbi:MAG: protein kinase domain-containing protein [Planctomycetota bacterium]|jgi:tetratricopeptide (TPR) repeat protein